MDSLVTIGLPCFNASRYIEYSLKSILNQTYRNWRLIIIDDNSTDNSSELIKRYLSDKRIIFLQEDTNKGLPFRLNQMISMTTTKYFARMDADDIMESTRLQQQVEVLESELDVDVLGTYVYSINENNNIIGKRGHPVPNSLRGAMWQCVFIHPTILGKTEWFKRNKYDSNCHRMEDYELWFRTFNFSNFMVLEKPLLFYREIDGNNRKKYWESKKNAYKIVRGNNSISNPERLFFIIVELFKGFIYILASKIGLENKLLTKRLNIIEARDIEKSKEKLMESIKKPI